MRFRKAENWKDPDLDRGLLFFAQRVDELSFSYTIDSYRAPTMSPPQLALECLSEVENARMLGKDANAVAHILEELESRLRSNIVVKNLISLPLDTYLSYDKASLDDIERKIRVLSQELSARSYALKCFELVEIACSSNRKSEIDFLARETVTALSNFGISASHINHVVVSHFFKDSVVDGVKSLKPFFKEIFPHDHLFEILFILDSPMEALSVDVLKVFHLSLHDVIPDPFHEKGRSKGIRKIKGGERYLLASKVRAPDKFAAVERAKQKIQRVHDLFGIFHHKEILILDESAQVVQRCCAEVVAKVEVHVNNMQFITDNTPSEAATKLERLMEVLRLPGGPDREKFFRVVSFHGSSGQSSSVETQIVNIWTSLETMAPSRSNSTIVASVVSGVLPFLCLNYYRRLIKTLTFDFVRWDRKLLSKAIKAAAVPEKGDLVDKVLALIALKENEDALENLFTDLKNFELLRFRAYTLNKIFASPSGAHEYLMDHRARVSWQLHRIYRTRNAIIHTGKTPANARSLFLNAHDYFDQVFEISSAMCSGSSGYNNYLDAFSAAEWHFQQYVKDLRSLNELNLGNVRTALWQPSTSPDPEKWLED